MRLICACISSFCLLSVALSFLPQVEGEYCDMVNQHQKSNGAYGWPPYKGQCKNTVTSQTVRDSTKVKTLSL